MRSKIFKYLRLSFVMVITMMSYAASAQSTVSGYVYDTLTKFPVPAVTVSVKGTTIATQTDDDGRFTIAAAPDAVLVFTAVNFQTLEVPVNGRANIEAGLAASTQQLSEVVVIGYGTVRKSDLTGSISQVSTDDFQSGQITSPEQLIAGKVAGVQIVSNGGAPGAGSTIRIRGGASLNASNDPLIVIDGVPLNESGISGSANALSLINPNDIETFSILKDASATAIYGSRASNGVIIITTKKGRAGAKAVISFNTDFSVSEAVRKTNVLSAAKLRQLVRATGIQRFIDLLGTANTNWQDEIYQTALSTDNNLSISGGLKNMPYRISVGYLNQEGVLKTGKLERYTAGVNVSPSLLKDHVKINLNLKGSISKTRFANEDAIGAAVFFDPTKPVYSDNERYNGYWEWVDATTETGLRALAPLNPVALLLDKHDNSNVKRSIGNALIDYKVHFLPDLHAFLNIGYDYAESNGTIVIDDSTAMAYRRSPDRKFGGVNNKYRQTRFDKLLEAYLNYTKDIGETRIEVVGGYAYQDFLTKVYNYADYFYNGEMMEGSEPNFAFDEPQYTLISYYGRANISLLGRYLFTGTIRTDGSSRFSLENRWGVFPSGAFAWNVKQENFLQDSKTFSDLKLRLGYGLTGQQSGIGLYDYTSYYGLSGETSMYQFGDKFYNLYAPSGYYPNREWEQTATFNGGLDFGFAQNRISGSVDVYYKKTSKLLNEIPQPAGSNFSNMIVANVGDMENKGIEVNLNIQPVKNENFVWDLNLNGTYNENEITNLTSVPNPNYPGNRYASISGGTGNTILINALGKPRGSFYVYKQVYDESNMPIDGLFEDLNRDGIINQNDLYAFKKGDPDYMVGISSNFNFNNRLNMGFVMRGSIGNYMYNNVFSNSATMRNILNPLGYINNGAAYNITSGIGDRYFLSDYYIQNASFLRMDNAYVSYRFGKVIRNTADLTVNANVQNVFVITRYVGLDPEISNGIDNNFYPRPRIITLGLNLKF